MRSSKTQPGNREQRIQALFEAARGLSPAQQASFLDQACAGDLEVRRELDAILAAARGPTDQRLRNMMDMRNVRKVDRRVSRRLPAVEAAAWTEAFAADDRS